MSRSERGKTIRLSVVSVLLLSACGDTGEKGTQMAAGPQALEVCKFAGQVECGVDSDGKSPALLLCEVTKEHGRVWTVKQPCPCGCKDAACLACPPLADGYIEPEDADVVEVAQPDLPPPCEPQCEGKECGNDGCGGKCGECEADYVCGEDFKCYLHCAPRCKGKQCGDDGCGGSCGDCPFNMACVDNMCVCKPQCEGKGCGPDGCGGQCGECPQGYHCSPFGECVPAP